MVKSQGDCLQHLTTSYRLERLSEDAEQRTFELGNDNLDEFVVNSTELRFSDVEMDKYVVPPAGPAVAAVRRSSRSSVRASISSAGVHVNKKYILPVEIEQHILKHCYE